MSERERKILRILFELTYDEEGCVYTRRVAREAGLDEQATRRAIRSLVRKGLAKYVRGLMDEDGMVAGSGYCISPEGRTEAESILTPPNSK